MRSYIFAAAALAACQTMGMEKAQARLQDMINQGIDHRPIHTAAETGDLSYVKLLMENRAEINATNIAGNTPLHLAVGHPEVVEHLLKNKATVNATNKGGYTPLHWAARSGNKDSTTMLLEAGADVNAATKDKVPKTVLDHAKDEAMREFISSWKSRAASTVQ